MDTTTVTKSVTNTQLAIATLVMLGAGAAAFVVAPSVASNGNTVKLAVNQVCRQAGAGYGYNNTFAGVEVVNTQTGTVVNKLPNGCRDAGHGMRDYVFTCTANPNTYYAKWVSCGNQPVPTASVTVSLDTSTPGNRLLTPSMSTTTLSVFNLVASSGDVDVKSLSFTLLAPNSVFASHLDYQTLVLEDASGTVLGQTVVPVSAKSVIRITNPQGLVLRAGEPAKVYLRAVFSPFDMGKIGGRWVGFMIAGVDDVTAVSKSSGMPASVSLASIPLSGYMQFLYKGVPSVETVPLSSRLANGTNDLFKFRVNANGSDVDLSKFTFEITTTTASVRSVEVLDVTDNVEVSLFTLTNRTANEVWNVDAVLSASRNVSRGQPRTFVLRGLVSGVRMGAAVSVRLGGDISMPNVRIPNMVSGMVPFDTLNTDANNDFLWSDRSALSHSTSTADWINGYKVPGLTAPKSTATVLSN